MSKPLADNRAETERVRAIHDKMAPGYDRQISVFERILFGDGRQWATSQAEGDVLEIAVGTGRNFQHYARGAKVTGIEFSAEMLAIGRKRAEGADIDIDLRQGDAQALRGRQSRSRTARLPGRSRLRDRECGPPEVGDRRRVVARKPARP